MAAKLISMFPKGILKLGKTTGEAELHLMVSNIATGLVVEGNMRAEGDMRIDGKIIGNVWCSGKIILGPQGIIEGDIEASYADIFGNVQGNLTIKNLLCLKNSCHIAGNLLVGKLDIEPDAYLDGQCKMMNDKRALPALAEAAAMNG